MINFGFDEKKNAGIISGDCFEEIRENFSVKNEAAFFMRRKYGRFLPQRTYAITPTGRFDPGLYFEIRKYLASKQYVWEVKTEETLLKEIMPSKSLQTDTRFSYEPIPLSIPLRDYQEEIVKKSLSIGRGTIVLATAGGKTLTAASLLTKLFLLHGSKFNCLYIVPDLGLVEQTSADFSSYNVPYTVRKWTGSCELKENANVTILKPHKLQYGPYTTARLVGASIVGRKEESILAPGEPLNFLFLDEF